MKSLVLVDPNYFKLVKDARAQAAEDAKQNQDPGGDAGSGPFHFNNSPGDLKKLTYLDNSAGKDLTHVNWTLLSRLNALGRASGKKVQIYSGFRSRKEQERLYAIYVGCHYCIEHIAAKPGHSNHEKGEAVDCGMGGVSMSYAVPSFVLAKYKLHCPVPGDHPHTTRIEISG